MKTLANLRNIKTADIQKLTEVTMRNQLLQSVSSYDVNNQTAWSQLHNRFKASSMTHKELDTIVKSGILTFLLHCEARVASNLGVGYYTIGPCGEVFVKLLKV